MASLKHAGPKHLKRQPDGRRLCICTCPVCFDNATKDLDAICICPDCPCVDSDHTPAVPAPPPEEDALTKASEVAEINDSLARIAREADGTAGGTDGL